MKRQYLLLIDNIWHGDLADIQLISKSNKRFKFLLCAHAFQKMLDESNHKPDKIWVDKGNEF